MNTVFHVTESIDSMFCVRLVKFSKNLPIELSAQIGTIINIAPWPVHLLIFNQQSKLIVQQATLRRMGIAQNPSDYHKCYTGIPLNISPTFAMYAYGIPYNMAKPIHPTFVYYL